MRKADNLPPSCAVVTKSGNLNFLEPSGPIQACNGTVLPLPLLDGGGWSAPRLFRSNPGNNPVPIVQEAEWARGVRKISPLPRIDPRTVPPVANRYTEYVSPGLTFNNTGS